MPRASLLRVLVARNAAARPFWRACAAAAPEQQQQPSTRAAASLATPPLPSPPPTLRATLSHPRPHSRLFASLSPAPASAAAAAAASPARAEEAAAASSNSSSSSSSSSSSADNSGANSGGVVVSLPLAQTGEGISECELVRWHVSPGDRVEEFQPLCEVQSDKASIEITSRHAGTVARLHHQPGDIVKVGAPLADVRLPAGAAAPPGAVVVEQQAGGAAAEEEGGVGGGRGQEGGGAGGGAAAAAAAAAAISAAAAEVLAPPAVRRLARELGVDLAGIAPGSGVGGRLTKEDVQAAADAGGGKNAAAPVAASPVAPPPPPPPLMAPPALPAAAPTAAPAAAAAPTFERIPIRGYARTMLRTSTEALSVPMFYYFDEVRVDALARLRAALNADPALLGAAGGGAAGDGQPRTKLTLLPFIVKALSVALAQHPAANASLELPPPAANEHQHQHQQQHPNQQQQQQQQQQQGGPSIIRYKEHNVGVAMATPGGLVVPNVKNVEKKTVAEVAAELSRLQRLAAEGRLPAEALSGGTITVSNIGALGGTHATPLVHPPQAAIVALGRARALPRFAAGGGGGGGAAGDGAALPRIESHLLMDVSWGADHRVVDGAEVARLSNCWRSLLEEPSRLLLHLR